MQNMFGRQRHSCGQIFFLRWMRLLRIWQMDEILSKSTQNNQENNVTSLAAFCQSALDCIFRTASDLHLDNIRTCLHKPWNSYWKTLSFRFSVPSWHKHTLLFTSCYHLTFVLHLSSNLGNSNNRRTNWVATLSLYNVSILLYEHK